MGTNYYLLKDICTHCGRYEEIHIGKSSGGWCFALHVTDEIKSLEDWKKLFSKYKIIDEYNDDVGEIEMIKIITERKANPHRFPDMFYSTEQEFHDRNNSEPGPNNLVRSKIDGSHCIGHGPGTWDLIKGEFS